MKNKPISDLRRRMLEDMAVRRLGEKTQHDYIKHVETFTRFLGRSPDTATAEDLRRFQIQELQQGSRAPKMNTQVSALRFFFGKTLGRLDLAHQLSRVDYPRKLPRVLSMQDVTRLLEAAPGPGLKYKAALSIAYGAGLRGGEVVMLRVSDIDSKRMLIRVEQGKGRKDRLYATNWHVYAKRPFAGPEKVLAYLSRYTHRVAISNRRLIKADATGVTFTFKDYRIDGPGRYKTMTLEPGEFIRRFMLHVLVPCRRRVVDRSLSATQVSHTRHKPLKSYGWKFWLTFF
jgi:site-specific recombinase XerC